jgi:hypothetical protein
MVPTPLLPCGDTFDLILLISLELFQKRDCKMPHSKRPRLLAGSKMNDDNPAVANDDLTTANKWSCDVVAIVFSFLRPKDIMRLRRVCTTWRDAAKKTIVPLTRFEINSFRASYNAVRAMSTALPNLQRLSICNLGYGHKYSDGEDPVEEMQVRLHTSTPINWTVAYTTGWTSHDIDIISRFRKLHILEIYEAPLNGRYRALFNFPLLHKLSIKHCSYLKWDLEMLEGLPSLKEFHCENNHFLTGNLNSCRVLKDTLEKVKIDCHNIEGNWMDLADFPHLNELDLRLTSVTGDIRDIGENDFQALQILFLPKGVHGGIGYKFEHISDVPEFLQAIHLLLKRSPDLFQGYDSLSEAFHWKLSRDSPDWYFRERRSPSPPFYLQIVQAGSRRGWSWCTWSGHHSCEINWLDPEPSSNSSDYGAYTQIIERHNIGFYRGYHQPPTEDQYRRLCERLT